jgi:hypothetical protein
MRYKTRFLLLAVLISALPSPSLAQSLEVEKADHVFIKNLTSEALTLRMLGLDGELKFKNEDGPSHVKIKIENVNPSLLNLRYEGQDIAFSSLGNSAYLDLDITSKGGNLSISTEEKPDYSFIVMGDNRDGDEVFQRILELASLDEPLFMVNTGDIVPRGRWNEYVNFERMVSILKVPLFISIGNHETYYFNPLLSHSGYAFFQQIYGPTYYSFNYGRDHFIILDSAFGGINSKAYDWLQEDLRQSKDSRSIFVFLHYPPFWPYEGRPKRGESFLSPEEGEKFSQLMSDFGVDIVFCGHLHAFRETEKGGVRYVITGGAGAPLGMPPDEGGFFHYIRVNVKDSGAQTEVVKIPPPEVELKPIGEKVYGPVSALLTSLAYIPVLGSFTEYMRPLALILDQILYRVLG